MDLDDAFRLGVGLAASVMAEPLEPKAIVFPDEHGGQFLLIEVYYPPDCLLTSDDVRVVCARVKGLTCPV